jgi:hypothetical protein
MAGEVKGERLMLFIGRAGTWSTWTGRKHLHTPDFVVNQTGTASQRRTGFFGPPLAALVPADRFGAYRVGTPGPDKGNRLAVSAAGDVNGFAEHAHGASLT